MLASYCLAAGVQAHNLDALSLRHFGYKKIPTKELLGTGKKRLALTGNYRIGVYEEDDSDALEGMGDRDDGPRAGIEEQLQFLKRVQNISVEAARELARGTEYEWHEDASRDPFAKLAGLV